MRIKGIVDTNYQDYKKCSMFIATEKCDWKCCKEAGCDICQNLPLATARVIDFDSIALAHRYIGNPLSSAIVVGGLEPFDTYPQLWEFVNVLRRLTGDEVVIYTGYREDEIADKVVELSKFPNIIIKFGRFIPNDTPRFDEVLGVTLASSNQYAKKIS